MKVTEIIWIAVHEEYIAVEARMFSVDFLDISKAWNNKIPLLFNKLLLESYYLSICLSSSRAYILKQVLIH